MAPLLGVGSAQHDDILMISRVLADHFFGKAFGLIKLFKRQQAVNVHTVILLVILFI